jgi:hypothetical protein
MEESLAPIRGCGAAARFIKKHMPYQDSRSAAEFCPWRIAAKEHR